MFGADEFARQLAELGYEFIRAEPNRVIVVDYAVTLGRFSGTTIQLGFEVPEDFPRNPPHGPHFTPALLPVNHNAPDHPDRVHESAVGADWRHWSRPYPNWSGKLGVAAYLTFVDHLFEAA